MYLKKIEVKGFKSFADKIELEFEKGINAIVGPNGSGKSNISDSVRWVLGEQSAKTLRGARMEDVIFAGTESRKPLGFAEVALTIDNSSGKIPLDYREITVARRLYRSGESEYYLNNTSCRLKDIVELFMDTGIGKDGYSLIGQGRIDEILSAKSEDRRNLFEEAAGIVKYKTRKQEAEKKLENTKQNLLRISDIIQQLEEQLEPLLEQSQTARRYLAFREELRELEINVILANNEAARERLGKIAGDIEELSSNYSINQERKNNLVQFVENLKEELNSINSAYEEKNNSRLEIEKNHENRQGEINLLNERHENYIVEKERLQRDIEEGKKSISYVNEELKNINLKKQSIESELNEKKKLIEETSIQFNEIDKSYIELENIINDGKSEAIQILKQISDTNNKISSSQIVIQNLTKRKEQLEKEIKIKNEKIDTVNIEINKVKGLVDDYNSKLNYTMENLKSASERVRNAEENVNNLKHQREKLFEELKTAEARYKTLLSMERDMEGFNKAVKSVLTKYKDAEKVYGTVSDIIQVPSSFEVAIEIALGAAIQNLIVNNEQTATDMINFLRKNNLGRATFLPLTTIKKREINLSGDIKKIEGFLGVASELVHFEDKFGNAVSNLLGRVLICDSLKNAQILAKRTDYSYRIVTLDGDVINAGGSFTGGSTNLKNNGILSRKNELKDLLEVIDAQKNKLGKIDSEINKHSNEFINNKNILEELNIEITDLKIKINKEENIIINFEREKSSYFENINDAQIEISQVEEQFKINEDLMNYNNNILGELLGGQKELEQGIEKLQLDYKQLQTQKESISEKLTNQKIMLAEKNQELESIVQQRVQLFKDCQSQEEKTAELGRNLEDSDKKIKIVEQDIKNKIIEIQKSAENIIGIKTEIESLEADRKQKFSLIAMKEKEMVNVDEVLKDLMISIHKLEISKSKIESEIEILNNKLWNDYEMTIPQALKYRKELKNISEANRKVNEIKNNIKSLGNVNVNSIEEYQRVKERYDFLKEQKEDLIQAEESLISVISEITKKMEVQFKENFKVIRYNFNETFKELFGGGYADLKLDEEDVLNSGVEIIVQPPGKKLQSLSLLSGGERGLSAIALIFAILKMKPTPFCILDEIEAALDDANVNRFAQFLKEYSKNTQFIAITHRKGSMAVSDALYGVTMEEKGVSKIISLKLKGGQ